MSEQMTPRKLGKRDGLRYAITWLHRRAKTMNDSHAAAVLNSAAFDLGNEIREGHMPSILDTDIATRLRRHVQSRLDVTGKPYIENGAWTLMLEAAGALAGPPRERFAAQAAVAERAKPTASDLEQIVAVVGTWFKEEPGRSVQPQKAAGELYLKLAAALAERGRLAQREHDFTKGLLRETQAALERAVISTDEVRRVERENLLWMMKNAPDEFVESEAISRITIDKAKAIHASELPVRKILAAYADSFANAIRNQTQSE